MPTLIPQSQQRQMRWKNGGGVTCEILRQPADSTLESFDWRVSVATVQQGGAFSLFPGIDRSLAILEGKGIVLQMPQQHVLTPADPPLRFDGDVAVQSSLMDGAVVDFNVMTRRSVWRHAIDNITLTRPMPLQADAQATLVYVIRGSCRLRQTHREDTLHAGDAALWHAGEEDCLLDPAGAAAEVMVVRLLSA